MIPPASSTCQELGGRDWKKEVEGADDPLGGGIPMDASQSSREKQASTLQGGFLPGIGEKGGKKEAQASGPNVQAWQLANSEEEERSQSNTGCEQRRRRR